MTELQAVYRASKSVADARSAIEADDYRLSCVLLITALHDATDVLNQRIDAFEEALRTRGLCDRRSTVLDNRDGVKVTLAYTPALDAFRLMVETVDVVEGKLLSNKRLLNASRDMRLLAVEHFERLIPLGWRDALDPKPPKEP